MGCGLKTTPLYHPLNIIMKHNNNITLLLLRNLIFTILKPGIVIILIPFMIIRDKLDRIIQPLQFYHYVGIYVFLIGIIIMLHCIIKFTFEGRGTLSPIEPTQRLVISGLYSFSRNPMYIGAILILSGEAIFFHSTSLCLYSIIIFLIFNIIIFLIEEPRLRNDFDKEYRRYCQNVRRWI